MRPLSFDLLAIGDATLDVFIKINEATVSCQLNKNQCLLCLEYAEKIPVETVIKIPGAGNASNVAMGGSRLGMKSAIVSILGKDETGREILKGWKRANIETAYVAFDPKAETNYSTILSFRGERTILAYSHPRHYRLPPICGASWIYYTSLGERHERMERQLLDHLKKNPCQKLAFNPGGAQLRRGLHSLTSVIRRSDLFIVNKDEAMRLLEDGDRSMENLLMGFAHLGAKNVVITDGPNGAYGTNGKEWWFCPIFPGPNIERTGAGDGFAVACVYALHKGWTLPEALRAGSANARSVIQKIGPQAGLLRERELKAVLKKFAPIKAKKI